MQERQGACQVRHQAAVSADNSSLLQAAASMETVTMSGARGREEGASMEARRRTRLMGTVDFMEGTVEVDFMVGVVEVDSMKEKVEADFMVEIREVDFIVEMMEVGFMEMKVEVGFMAEIKEVDSTVGTVAADITEVTALTAPMVTGARKVAEMTRTITRRAAAASMEVTVEAASTAGQRAGVLRGMRTRRVAVASMPGRTMAAGAGGDGEESSPSSH